MLSCIPSVQVLFFHTNFLREPGFENYGVRSGVWKTGGMNHHHHSLHVRPELPASQILAGHFAASQSKGSRARSPENSECL